MKRYVFFVIFTFAFALCFSACGISNFGTENTKNNIESEEDIELIEPVFTENETECESVLTRTICNALTYSAIVNPYTEEYVFPVKVNGFDLCFALGTKVNAGDIICVGNTEYLQKEINSYETKISELNKKSETNPEMAELYAVDINYYKEKLDALYAEKENYIIRSGIKGYVSFANFNTTTIPAGNGIVAVSDLTRKVIRTSFIKKSVLTNALNIFAFVNGERYEVSNITEEDEKVYSYFEIIDTDGKIASGDGAVLVIIEENAENVLSVSAEHIKTDTSGEYVYIKTENGSEKRYIKTGVTDGVFTEIVYGVAEGEKIFNSTAFNDTGNYGYAEIGEITTKFSGNLQIRYSESYTEKSKVDGTVYFDSFNTESYSLIGKGDLICTIHTEIDDVEYKKAEQKLMRAKERGESADVINKLQETLDYYDYCAGITGIYAEHDGIVLSLGEFESGDKITYGAAIIEIADITNCYLVATADDKNKITFGSDFTVTYSAGGTDVSVTTGSVTAAGNMNTLTGLKSDTVLVSVPDSDFSNILGSLKNFYSRSRIKGTCVTSKIENVVTVPKKAVTVYSGKYIVSTVDSDGNILKKTIVVGGNDNEKYYVISGLKEGEKVCLK